MQEDYLDIFIVENRQAMVCDHKVMFSTRTNVYPIFKMDAFDCEIPSLCSLLERLSVVVIQEDHPDRRIWVRNSNGFFSMSSCYSFIESSRDLGIP